MQKIILLSPLPCFLQRVRNMMKNLKELPKLRDSISYFYVEHAIIDQNDSSIILHRRGEDVPVPVSALTCLMLGPGTNITHAAIKTATENGCMIVWCGENGAKFYASGMGETRNAKNTLLQAKCCMDEGLHMRIVRRMYEIRFPKMNCEKLTLQQIRGMEGIRVRKEYQAASKINGIPWKKRDYKQTEWQDSDGVNRALSAANAVLYSVCQAAIYSLGYSSALGFVHTGKMLSFVYDVADLYKAETTIPVAFEAVKRNAGNPETEVRALCRKYFHAVNLMQRIARDLAWLFEDAENEQQTEKATGDLWDDEGGIVAGGVNYAEGEGCDDCSSD